MVVVPFHRCWPFWRVSKLVTGKERRTRDARGHQQCRVLQLSKWRLVSLSIIGDIFYLQLTKCILPRVDLVNQGLRSRWDDSQGIKRVKRAKYGSNASVIERRSGTVRRLNRWTSRHMHQHSTSWLYVIVPVWSMSRGMLTKHKDWAQQFVASDNENVRCGHFDVFKIRQAT